MNESYLTAHTGVCIGGMFFKVGDNVKVEGRGLSGKQKMIAEGKIISLDAFAIDIMRTDFNLVRFNNRKILSIEHIKEEL